ncbi:hypothetical protein ACFGZK_11020 [Pasteurella multocida]
MNTQITPDDLEELETLLSEIARKNGVIVNKDDPIAIAFIFNQYLIKQTKENQNRLVQNLKSDIEEIILKTLNSSNSVIEDSRQVSLKLVNEHISKSKTAISNVIEEASNDFNQRNKDSIDEITANFIEKMNSVKNALYILSGVNIIITIILILSKFF